MIRNLHQWSMRACMAFALLACTLPAFAQTRAWLDREQVTFGETATLNIETDTSVRQIDYAPLAVHFDIAGQTVRRSFQLVDGRSSTRSLFAVGIRPRAPGVFTVPALRVGSASTEPLRLTVLPPTVQPASGNADVFVETEVDADQPYVQQAVGMVVRLYVGVDLLSGQLDQDQPPDTSLQQVGEDLRYQKQIDGRRFSVIESRYLLIPDRSGELTIPGARFNGQSMGDFFDGAFGGDRKSLSAAAPPKHLQVQPIPAGAPQPWLPLHDLKLRYISAPTQARAGVATTLELEMSADGASATQLPALAFPPSKDMQVFADPPQTDVQLVDGRPRATVRQRISIVPLHAGTLSLRGPRVDWWDATQGVARIAALPSLTLDVAPGEVATSPASNAASAGGQQRASVDAASRQADTSIVERTFPGSWRRLPWLVAMLALAVILGGWRFTKHRRSATGAPATPPSASPPVPTLGDALGTGELGAIARALCHAAGLPGEDLDALRMRLEDGEQIAAVDRLRAARWGAGDATVALASLRKAFASGVKRGKRGRKGRPAPLLPPLYPEA
jgi:hypothetical protein